MLVLTRRVGEAIILPGLAVTVRVVSLTGGRVRLGIDAPPDVSIMREELIASCVPTGKLLPLVPAV